MQLVGCTVHGDAASIQPTTHTRKGPGPSGGEGREGPGSAPAGAEVSRLDAAQEGAARSLQIARTSASKGSEALTRGIHDQDVPEERAS